jgi:hypothetical protein
MGFVAWAAAAALAALAVAAAPSFGILLLPVAAAMVVATARRIRVWPEAFGVLEGLAAIALVIGLRNLGSSPCPTTGELILSPGQHEVTCGGLEPAPFLVAALILAMVGLAGYRRAGQATRD